MILPIYTYGQPVLRDVTRTVETDSPEVQRLIDDMIETMYNAKGIGLAAPQVGRTERLFVVDLSGAAEELAEEQGGVVPFYAKGPMVLINPEIVEADEDTAIDFEEGCLSIPDLTDVVVRPDAIRVRFQDRRFETHELEVDDLFSRVIQHELDHLDGILFVDYLSPLRKRLLKRRLRDMAEGAVDADYPLMPPGATQPV